ncbi:hypothetical protein M569_02990 [Genlisea aurea]|uniref:LsmAD domain-containing protein n=1 Tax=Genlisea aurea TaxID=192259 RepID=S8CWH7_9LAMI|nr:hypothetical protein M569_02990 [Genlisea aurea]
MAHAIKDTSHGQKNVSDFSGKPLAKTFIVPAAELVQVVAKGISVTSQEHTNEPLREKQPELLTDSSISQFWHTDAGRELERWVPDENDPGCPELESTFDAPWNRGWDQFEANETLFGVKSTFDEELYTTKLERGPRMLELERVAEQLAREMEGEDTNDLHLAEERGLQINGNLDIDEETRFSSVYRGVDASGCDEIDDLILNPRNDETFGAYVEGRHDFVNGKPLLDVNVSHGDATQMHSRSSSMGEVNTSQTDPVENAFPQGSENNTQQILFGQLPRHSSITYASRDHGTPTLDHSGNSSTTFQKEKLLVSVHVADQSSVSKAADVKDLELRNINTSSRGSEKESSSNEQLEDRGGIASTSAGRGLSSSSSVGSLSSSEKSTLNPHAKEFKLNPNAKSFVPSHIPLRASSPIADSPFYYPANVAAATAQIHGLPVGIGIGPSFTIHQPVLLNPQAETLPQPYYHPNGPQYGQQMMVRQPRPVFYMPTYAPEMPYKGREF